MIAYKIKDWDLHFEKAQTRKCKDMKWVAFPNKFDGAGFRRIAQHERSVELFAAWILIVEVASRMKTRGLLVSNSGKALTADDLSVKTGFTQAIFNLAFEILTREDIAWVERVNIGMVADYQPDGSQVVEHWNYRTEQDS